MQNLTLICEAFKVPANFSNPIRPLNWTELSRDLKKDWKDTGRLGKVPSDPFVELRKRQAYADMEKVMEERNKG